MNFSEMKVGSTYSFSVHSSHFLGTAFVKAKLLAVMNFEAASAFEPIEQRYAEVFPSLPPETVRSPKTQQYFLFQQQNGQKIILCAQWMIENSIALWESVQYTVTIHDAQLSDADRIKAALNGIGLTNVVVLETQA